MDTLSDIAVFFVFFHYIQSIFVSIELREKMCTYNITISKFKELHQSNRKSAIQEIQEKLKAIIDCEDTDFSDFVDAVAHDYALPAVRDYLIFTQLLV